MNFSKKNSRNGKKSKLAAGTSLLHDDIKELVEAEKASASKFLPEIRDVPRMRIRRDKVYTFELSYIATQALSTTAPNFGALAFSLASSSASTGYTSVFDQYRIVQVNVKLMPVGVIVGGGNYFMTVIDEDDANLPTSVSTYLGYPTLKVTPASIIDERTLTPKCALAAYAGATFNGYVNAPGSTWVDVASPGVQYYGLKWYSPQAGPNTSVMFIVTMVIQFKSQRSA